MVKRLRQEEQDTLSRAEKKRLRIGEINIQTYRWQSSGSQAVLLIHGWEGQAGNLAEIAEALLEENFTVFAFDAPSHGLSNRGKTSLFEFGDVVKHLLESTGIKLVIAHSFGCVALAYTLNQNPHIAIDKYVAISTPDTFEEYIDDALGELGLTTRVKGILLERLKLLSGKEIDALSVSQFVKSINVSSALLLHGKADKVIPIDRARKVASNWPLARLVELEGLGHFRILSHSLTIGEIISFLKKE